MHALQFESSSDFRRWLEKNHAGPDGIWLRFFKKGSLVKSLTHAEALDQALCHGWIDGQFETIRSTVLASEIHAEASQERLVQNQHPARRAPCQGRGHDSGRTGRSRSGQG